MDKFDVIFGTEEEFYALLVPDAQPFKASLDSLEKEKLREAPLGVYVEEHGEQVVILKRESSRPPPPKPHHPPTRL
ncbi:MAG: hypothetical protein R2865_00940 [Deinococcales bacterium]